MSHKPVFYTVLVLILVLGSLYALTRPQEPPRTLVWPEKQHLELSFKGDLSYYKCTLSEKQTGNAFHFEGVLKGVPHLLNNGSSYRCRFERLSIWDQNQYLVLSFGGDADRNYQYSIDPRFSDDDRLSILESFLIDTSDQISSNDRSLLQQEITFYVSSEGQIKEILFTPPTRAALFTATSSHPGAAILRDVLSSPTKIPPLLPQTPPQDQWTSKSPSSGLFTFSHTLQNRWPPILQIRSVSIPAQNGSTATFSPQLELLWEYDEKAKSIPRIAMKGFLEGTHSFMQAEATATYSLKIEASTAFVTAPFAQATEN